jgi:dephospho-CoA kinase
MKLIGLTGGFGTGKSFVASVFASLGAKVIDADKIAHSLLKKGSPVHARIIRTFGKDILNRKGDISRKRLGRIVFGDRRLLKKLENITHPEIIKRIRRIAAPAACDEAVILDAPLIVESGAGLAIDKLIVVSSSKTNQIRRCIGKFRMSKEDVAARLASQLPLSEKIKKADFVIDNDGPRGVTKKQVKKIWETIYGNS